MIIKILLPIRSEKIFFYKISHSKNIKKGTLVEVDFRGKKKNWGNMGPSNRL